MPLFVRLVAAAAYYIGVEERVRVVGCHRGRERPCNSGCCSARPQKCCNLLQPVARNALAGAKTGVAEGREEGVLRGCCTPTQRVAAEAKTARRYAQYPPLRHEVPLSLRPRYR